MEHKSRIFNFFQIKNKKRLGFCNTDVNSIWIPIQAHCFTVTFSIKKNIKKKHVVLLVTALFNANNSHFLIKSTL